MIWTIAEGKCLFFNRTSPFSVSGPDYFSALSFSQSSFMPAEAHF